jgi:hypothetical protein
VENQSDALKGGQGKASEAEAAGNEGSELGDIILDKQNGCNNI